MNGRDRQWFSCSQLLRKKRRPNNSRYIQNANHFIWKPKHAFKIYFGNWRLLFPALLPHPGSCARSPAQAAHRGWLSSAELCLLLCWYGQRVRRGLGTASTFSFSSLKLASTITTYSNSFMDFSGIITCKIHFPRVVSKIEALTPFLQSTKLQRFMAEEDLEGEKISTCCFFSYRSTVNFLPS